MNRELLSAFDAELKKLIALLPDVHRAVSDLAPIENEQRWHLLRQNSDDLSQRKLPVVTLVGPSGSGKSTLFRLLSGIDVPCGGVVRPNTHNCAVAVPPSISEADLRAIFPAMQLRPLDNPIELRNDELPRETLFFSAMSPEAATRGDFLLCDVPDFSTICLENWEKAKLMLQRSEVVIFVVYKGSYADYQTTLYLARTCAHAAHLAYVLTKATPDEAREIRTDLIKRIAPDFRLKPSDSHEDTAQPFAEPRAGGLRRIEFLAAAEFYSSDEQKEPKLDEIRSLADGAPPLADLLRGQSIACLMLTKRANDIQQGLALADATLTAHAQRFGDLRTCHTELIEQLENETLDVVGSQLPLGDILQNVIRETQEVLPPWKRRLSIALNLPLKIVRLVPSGIALLVRKLKDLSNKENIQPFRRDLVEREALRHHAELLQYRWRADYARHVKLSAESCGAAKLHFESQQVPEPDAEWNDYASRRAREWVQQNPQKATALLTVGGVVGLLAPVAFTVDLFVSYGVVTIKVSTWTAIGTAGAGALTVGALLHKLIEKFGMERLVKDFQAEWKRQRNRQLRAHLREHFARPLILDTIERRIDALAKAPTDECARTVTALRCLLAENLTASLT